MEASQKHQADARVPSYSLPNDTDMDKLLRYDNANSKKLHKTMDQLRQVQAYRRRPKRPPAT